jgi:diacylglycerol kinase family enzyme
MSDVLVLMNALSGRASQEGPSVIEAGLRAVLQEAGREAEFVKGKVPELLDALRASSADMVLTVGGDGTIGAAASVLAAREEPPLFVPLPYGTANLIPRDVGMPLDPEEALRASLKAGRRRIDYAEADGRALLHSAVFGTFAEVAEKREEARTARGLAGQIEAARRAAEALLASRPSAYHITIDGEPLDATTNAVFVTNNAITGGERGVPVRERLDAGELVVYLSDARDPLGFVRTLIEAVTGGFDESHGVVRHVCRTATVRAAEGRLAYTVDGEVLEGEEVRFEVRPGALVVPDLRSGSGPSPV